MKRMAICFAGFVVLGMAFPAMADAPDFASLSKEAPRNNAAFHQLEDAAKGGNAEARYYLGEMYLGYAQNLFMDRNETGDKASEYGDNSERRGLVYERAAATLFYMAAGQGYAKAERRMGDAFAAGTAITSLWPTPIAMKNDSVIIPSVPHAMSWYLKAATDGDIKAMDDLSRIYSEGRGVPKDKKKSEYWFKKSTVKPSTFVVKNDRFEQRTKITYDMPGSAFNGYMDFTVMSDFSTKGRWAPVYSMMLTITGQEWKYLHCHEMDWLVDGKPMNFWSTRYDDQMGSGDYVMEFFNITPKRTSLEALAKASKVEYRICNTEYVLTRDELDGIRKMLDKTDSFRPAHVAGHHASHAK